MTSTTLPANTAAGLVGFALANRKTSRPGERQTVCWWNPIAFGLPSCQLRAGFDGNTGSRCCMQSLASSTPTRH
jgi:hypothetical protein